MSASDLAPTALVRELRAEEFSRLAQLPYFSEYGVPSPRHMRVIVMEDAVTSEIIGYWAVMTVFHTEPIWLAPNRKEARSRGAIEKLLEGVGGVLRQEGAAAAVVVIDRADVADMVTKLGFEPCEGQIYRLLLEPATLEEETVMERG